MQLSVALGLQELKRAKVERCLVDQCILRFPLLPLCLVSSTRPRISSKPSLPNLLPSAVYDPPFYGLQRVCLFPPPLTHPPPPPHLSSCSLCFTSLVKMVQYFCSQNASGLGPFAHKWYCLCQVDIICWRICIMVEFVMVFIV